MSSKPLVTKADSASQKKAAKAADANATAARTYEGVILFFSIAAIIALCVPVIVQMVDPLSPAMLRTAPLLLNAIFFVVTISVAIDHELFDFITAFVIGGIALLANLPLLIEEINRWNRCSGGGSASVTPTETLICTDYTAWVYFIPLLTIILASITLILIILLALWLRKAIAQVKQAQKDQKELRKEGLRLMRSNAFRLTNMVVSVLQLVIILVVAGAATFLPDNVAFFRASFLIPAAFMAASEFAFFGIVPKYWTFITLLFAVFATIANIWGLVFEYPRWIRCISTPSSPDGVIENTICLNEGLSIGIIPVALLISVLLSIVCIASSLAMIFSGTDSPFARYKSG
jgi:hypothetical protein